MNRTHLLSTLSVLCLLSACAGANPTPSSKPAESSSVETSGAVTSSEAPSGIVTSSEESSSEATSGAVSSSSQATSSVTPSSSAQPSSSVQPSSSAQPSSSSAKPSSSAVPSSSSSAPKPAALDPYAEPKLGQQYYLNHIGDIFSAWKQYTGKGVTIAVIDMGFKPTHEDFYFKDGTSKVTANSASFTTTGNNTVTAVGADKVVNLGESHGTFCAGVAAAAANGKGVIGVAPDANLMLLKTDRKPKSIAAAFRYAADNGAKVITISIGSYYYEYIGDLVDDGSDLATVFNAPVQYCLNKGVTVVSAAGNGGEMGEDWVTEYTFPGATPGVIGVGGLAANKSTEIWSGSSYNSSPAYQFVDVVAPANGMYGCCHYDGKDYDGGWNGTSFASPIVAGMAALYYEANPTHTPAQFEAALYNSCVSFTPDGGKPAKNQIGKGRVDVGRLLGISVSSSIAVTCVNSRWTNCYCYAWNSVTGTALSSWPGKAMSKSSSTYTYTIPAGYDSVIFNNGSGQQSPDLLVSSLSGARYNLSTYASLSSSVQIGSYTKVA